MNQDAYNEIELLLHLSKKLLEEKSYWELFQYVLTESQEGAGWTDSVNQIYTAPSNSEEQYFSNELRKVLIKTIRGFLETAKPTADEDEYVVLEAIAFCIFQLGQKAPASIITTVREMIVESHKMGAPQQVALIVPTLELLSDIS